MFKKPLSITPRFDDIRRSNWSLHQRPCDYCCSPVKTVYCFHTASPPDFTGNVLRALLKAKAGTTVTLECKPQAYPTASILWKKGNLPIQTSDRWGPKLLHVFVSTLQWRCFKVHQCVPFSVFFPPAPFWYWSNWFVFTYTNCSRVSILIIQNKIVVGSSVASCSLCLCAPTGSHFPQMEHWDLPMWASRMQAAIRASLGTDLACRVQLEGSSLPVSSAVQQQNKCLCFPLNEENVMLGMD